MADEHLKTYLNDHLAGSVAALELIERSSESNAERPLGVFLKTLHAEVEADQDVLRELLRRVGGGENPAKKAAAWLLEKVSRAKLNDHLVSYSPLSRLEELEGLVLGVRGKLALWDSLSALADERFAGLDLEDLKARARAQLEDLERFRLEAAREALAR